MMIRFALAIIATMAVWLETIRPAAAFTMAVSPTRFEVPLGSKPVARSLKVINRGSEPMNVSIKVGNFDLDEKNHTREIAPNEQSLDQWIIIRPLKFTVPAGKTRTIRFAIRPYTKPSPGEHRAMIFLEQGNSKKKKKTKSLDLRFRFGVAVYGHAGPKRHSTKVHGIDAGAAGFGVDIQNSGNAHIRMKGRYAIWPAGKFPGASAARVQLLAAQRVDGNIVGPKGVSGSGLLPGTPVLPGYRRQIKAQLAEGLKPGSYQLVVAGKLGNSALNRTIAFTVGK